MFSNSNRLLLLSTFVFIFSAFVFGQSPTPTPPDEPAEIIKTDEIKVNISALDLSGNFAEGLKKEDVVIIEDGRLHQANIIQHVPAKVLILLDTGGENRQAKDFATTRKAAKKLIDSLQPDDEIAVMQYNDKVEILSGWTKDKAALSETLSKR